MPCSEAQIAANRANALQSSGPKTLAGKLATRRNALKHGLTGQGVVVPGEDAEAIDRRSSRFVAELAGDGSVTTLLLAQRVAVLTVRIERSVRHEFATTAERVRVAGEEFDEARQATARRLLAEAATDPTARAALRALPEGVDLLLDTLRTLRPGADPQGSGGWSAESGHRLAGCLSERDAASLRSMPPTAPGAGAPEPILELIDAEVAQLEALRRTLGPVADAVADQRAGVIERALVADDPAAILARKYEAATERSIFRALREIRAVRHAQEPAIPPAEPIAIARSLAATQGQIARLSPPLPGPAMGSFLPADPPVTAPIHASRPVSGAPLAHRQSRYADRKKRPRLTS